jgi:hypothetical protein
MFSRQAIDSSAVVDVDECADMVQLKCAPKPFAFFGIVAALDHRLLYVES